MNQWKDGGRQIGVRITAGNNKDKLTISLMLRASLHIFHNYNVCNCKYFVYFQK